MAALRMYDQMKNENARRPVEEGRFKRALQHARDFLEARNDGKIGQQRMRLFQDSESAPQYLTRLKVKSADRIVFLPVDQIDWLEASDNYVILHVGKQTHILREKLSRSFGEQK